MEYIISDTHFYHEHITGTKGFCKTRKHFSGSKEMNETIIDNWNAVVGAEDTVYHLGDIGLGRRRDVLEILKRLNGRIYFVRGNHDCSRDLTVFEKESPILLEEPKFKIIPMGTIKKRKGIMYYLTHYPQKLGASRLKIRNLCGHLHESESSDPNVLNVGIDSPEIKTDNYLFGAPIPLNHAMDLVDQKHEQWIEKTRNS